MPIYEYKCNECNSKFSILLFKLNEAANIVCSYCNSSNVRKLVSVFCVHQTEGAKLAGLSASDFCRDGFYRDPRNIGLRTKKKLKEMGVDLGPQLDEIVEKGRTGKIFDDV